jgi:hypothetical protein
MRFKFYELHFEDKIVLTKDFRPNETLFCELDKYVNILAVKRISLIRYIIMRSWLEEVRV